MNILHIYYIYIYIYTYTYNILHIYISSLKLTVWRATVHGGPKLTYLGWGISKNRLTEQICSNNIRTNSGQFSKGSYIGEIHKSTGSGCARMFPEPVGLV